MADIIAVISKGTLAELGTHDELLARNGTYANLVRIQVGGKIDTEKDQEQEEVEQQVFLKYIIYLYLSFLFWFYI